MANSFLSGPQVLYAVRQGGRLYMAFQAFAVLTFCSFWLTSITDTVKSLVYWMRRKTIIPTLCVSRSAHSFSESGFVKTSKESLIVSLGISSQFGQRHSSSRGGGVSYFIKTTEQASWMGNKWGPQPDLRRAVMWEGVQFIQGAFPGACWSWKNQPQDASALGNIWVLVPRPLGSMALDVDRKVIPFPRQTQRSPEVEKRGQGSSLKHITFSVV